MAITISLRSEDGVRIEGEEHTYSPIVEWVDRARFPMLGHIDSYGNTIFNGGQMQTLIEGTPSRLLARILAPYAGISDQPAAGRGPNTHGRSTVVSRAICQLILG